MKVLLVSANLGAFDVQRQEHFAQDTKEIEVCAIVQFTDENFPPRVNSLHPRMQAKIPKFLAWEYFPGYDYYIWMDGSVRIKSPNFIKKILSLIGRHDMMVMKHPERNSIGQEFAYVDTLMRAGSIYLNSRYAGEAMGEQVSLYLNTPGFVDDRLFACTYFCYTGLLTRQKPEFFSDWYYHCCRYSVQDQLSLPFLLYKHNINYTQFDSLEFQDLLEWTGNKRTRIG
jgi:hypothetical protein